MSASSTIDQPPQFNLTSLIERAFATPAAQLGWFLLFALLTRVSTFGDPNYLDDELLYFTIGQRMHDGLLPYVDLWDRKGPGLFLLYYLIAGFARSVIAYQLAATLFAGLTGYVAQLIAMRFAGRIGAMLAGTLYIALLPLFAGGGGQAAVFYNLFVAVAALMVLQQTDVPRTGPLMLAMAAAGFAITFKQTAVFECVFLGLFALWRFRHSGADGSKLVQTALWLALAGAAPMLLFTLFYALIGHFSELWHALVLANLRKSYNPAGDALLRLGLLTIRLLPVLIPAILTLCFARRLPRGFLCGWLIAASIGFLSVPNFIDHYMIPLALPVSIAAAPALQWRKAGPIFAYVMLIVILQFGPAFHLAERDTSRAAMAALVRDIQLRDPRPRLLVFQGPAYLYALTGSYPPTPLIFPLHLFYQPENNTSHLDTAGEMRKILVWQPSVVVTQPDLPRDYLNPRTTALVEAYVAQHCRKWFDRTLQDRYGTKTYAIFGDCAGLARHK